jgi:hypothetical protein
MGQTNDRAWLAGLSGLFVLGVAGAVVASTSITGGAVARGPELGGLILIGPVFTTLAAVLLPALVLGIGPRMAGFPPGQILLCGVLAFIALVVPWGVSRGNLWMESGLGGDLLLSGTRDAVISPDACAISRQLAQFPTVILVALTFRWGQQPGAGQLPSKARRLRSRYKQADSLLLLFVLAYGAELVAIAPSGS